MSNISHTMQEQLTVVTLAWAPCEPQPWWATEDRCPSGHSEIVWCHFQRWEPCTNYYSGDKTWACACSLWTFTRSHSYRIPFHHMPKAHPGFQQHQRHHIHSVHHSMMLQSIPGRTLNCCIYLSPPPKTPLHSCCRLKPSAPPVWTCRHGALPCWQRLSPLPPLAPPKADDASFPDLLY